MATPRPYGRGPYGEGAYERWIGILYECGGLSSIAFAAQAAPSLLIRPWAVSGIAWSAEAHGLGLTWGDIAGPCQGGVWTPAEACVPGWTTVYAPCSPGAWIPANPSTPGPRL